MNSKFDSDKFQEILLRIDKIALDLDCSYALPVNENEDGTSDVYGIIIGDAEFISAIVKTLEINEFEAKKIAVPAGTKKPSHSPKKTDDSDDGNNDPTFH